MKNTIFALALLSGSILASSFASASTVNTGPGSGSISAFGFSDSQTYGQVFTAPTSGVLTDFTLSLDGGVGGNIYGGVGLWNGSAGFAFGGGNGGNLYTSGLVSELSGGSFTFNPGINVVAGTLYVAYVSVFGTNANTTTSMPFLFGGSGDANANYFVWNNTNGGPLNSSWNYFSDYGDAQFVANISAVPVPAALPLFLGALAGLGAVARRRKRAV